jgi:hypothetical protein
LLPDFVAHVPVRGMQPLQVRSECINILKGEFGLVKPPHEVENIKRPTARLSNRVY